MNQREGVAIRTRLEEQISRFLITLMAPPAVAGSGADRWCATE
jgi:hypothetical protein